MSQMITYPGFSVVFIQTFSIHHSKEFVAPEHLLPPQDAVYESFDPERKVFLEKADALRVPIARMGGSGGKERKIEEEIFVLSARDPMVSRFSLRGFDFSMPIVPHEDEAIYEVRLSGHCSVEMNLFFGHVVSLTYRFLFDGHACQLSKPVVTDHIIAFLSNWLSAEFWSKEEGGDKTSIEYQTHFSVDKVWMDADGHPLEQEESIPDIDTWRSFDAVALRYKNFIYQHCTRFKKEVSAVQRRQLTRGWVQDGFNVHNDSRYAMVDVWENLRHLEEDGTDLFSNQRKNPLTEPQIIEHLKQEHKEELMGLLSLYPEEWRYRDAEAFDEVCGENIAIDTDDLVLAGSSLCVVIGTYGRRGSGEEGANWAEHLKERVFYHVSWPEYLMILEMILAKKHVIGLATDMVVSSTRDVENKPPQNVIGENSALSIRLTRMVTLLDVVKYSKYPSHKVMFDRTTARLGLEADYERLNVLMEKVDGSLHNLSDFQSMRSEMYLNILLGIVSVVSTFELLFQKNEMPFLTHFGLASSRLAAVVVAAVAAVAAVAIFTLLWVLVKGIRSIARGRKGPVRPKLK